MSYIEMPVAEYRRRLAALPSRGGADPHDPSSVRIVVPVGAVSADEVLAARSRYPRAFAAIDADTILSPAEIGARERLVTEAIRVGYLPPK
ncbi:MAG TPA: hypothetical protein VGO26_00885 [Amnibacterium sp.]|jgi:hypothetical protein|nr:hypothetical protein [Amnibacterium sp.]